jgi:hypothetical protein
MQPNQLVADAIGVLDHLRADSAHRLGHGISR